MLSSKRIVKKKRQIIIGFTVASLVALASWGAIEIRWMNQRLDVLANCDSDRLHPLSGYLESYAEAHGGHFPESTHISDILADLRDTNLLVCVRSKRPFVWNGKLARIHYDEQDRRLLAWCPPGSHGRYVGVLFVSQRNVEAEIITVNDLQRLLESESRR